MPLLSSLLLTGTQMPNLNIGNLPLSRKAIIELFESLAVVNDRTIALVEIPTSTLTDEDLAIA